MSENILFILLQLCILKVFTIIIKYFQYQYGMLSMPLRNYKESGSKKIINAYQKYFLLYQLDMCNKLEGEGRFIFSLNRLCLYYKELILRFFVNNCHLFVKGVQMWSGLGTSTHSATETYYSAIYRRYTELQSNILHEETNNPALHNKDSLAN